MTIFVVKVYLQVREFINPFDAKPSVPFCEASTSKLLDVPKEKEEQNVELDNSDESLSKESAAPSSSKVCLHFFTLITFAFLSHLCYFSLCYLRYFS